MNNMNEKHMMDLVQEHEGTEEWHCPTCGRMLLIEWSPWRKVVLQEGDPIAAHNGSKGGLTLGQVDVGV